MLQGTFGDFQHLAHLLGGVVALAIHLRFVVCAHRTNIVTQCAQLIEQQIGALHSAVENTQLLMTYGSATYLEVLYAQQALLNAQLGEAENKFSELQGVVNLYQSLGGGRQ